MSKTRNAKVLLVVLLFVAWCSPLTPASAYQHRIQPVQAATGQGDMIDISDAINLVETMENGLHDILSILLDLRYVASRSARGLYSDIQREEVNTDFQAWLPEIDPVAESIEYNGFKMLNGSVDSVFVRQMRKSFVIKGIEMTRAGLGLDGDNLDISTDQSASQTMEFLNEAIAVGAQAMQTCTEYLISLMHLPQPNRRIDRQDDDLVNIDEGLSLLTNASMVLEEITRNVHHLRILAVISAQSPDYPAQMLLMNAQFQQLMEQIDLLAKTEYRGYYGFKVLSSSTGSITVRVKGKPLVVEMVDVTTAGLGLDDLNIETVQSAEQAMEYIDEALDLLLSIYLTYDQYVVYLLTAK